MVRSKKPESIKAQFENLPIGIQEYIIDESNKFNAICKSKMKYKYPIMDLTRIHKISMIKYYYGRYCNGKI